MGLLLLLKNTVNKEELLLFSKKNIFHSFLNVYRWSFLVIGQWPNQNKFYCLIMRIFQIIISAIMIKGQVTLQFNYFTVFTNFHFNSTYYNQFLDHVFIFKF